MVNTDQLFKNNVEVTPACVTVVPCNPLCYITDDVYLH